MNDQALDETCPQNASASLDDAVETESSGLNAEQINALIETGALVFNSVALVEVFHGAFDVPVQYEPQMPDGARVRLRLDLLREELRELDEAFANGDLLAVADALTDLQYVLDGTYLECGLGAAKQNLVNAVHVSNMSKLGDDGQPLRRDDGKILKGPHYCQPDIAGALALTAASQQDADEETPA